MNIKVHGDIKGIEVYMDKKKTIANSTQRDTIITLYPNSRLPSKPSSCHLISSNRLRIPAALCILALILAMSFCFRFRNLHPSLLFGESSRLLSFSIAFVMRHRRRVVEEPLFNSKSVVDRREFDERFRV